MAKLDRKLNIVLQLENGWVHSTPISYSVFEKYFMALSKTFASIYSDGLGAMAGTRVAYLVLKRIAEREDQWEGAEGIENGLMNEIYRLTNVVIPKEGGGWQMQPFYDVKQQGLLDESEQSEVINSLVFFTLVSSMHRKKEQISTLSLMTKLWGGQTTLLSCTEYMNSLQTLIPVANSGENVPIGPVPVTQDPQTEPLASSSAVPLSSIPC